MANPITRAHRLAVALADWYACEIHSKQHERDLGRTVPLERKRKAGPK